MKGTTWVQIVKAVLLIAGAVADDGPGAGEVRLQPLRPARRRRRRQSGKGERVPGARPAVRRSDRHVASSTSSRSALALVLGTAGLPHILMRFYTVPDGQGAPARRWSGRSA